jgi:hypothetical protein
VEDHDWKKLKQLAASPQVETELDRIDKLKLKYFDAISDKLRAGNVLIRKRLGMWGMIRQHY